MAADDVRRHLLEDAAGLVDLLADTIVAYRCGERERLEHLMGSVTPVACKRVAVQLRGDMSRRHGDVMAHDEPALALVVDLAERRR